MFLDMFKEASAPNVARYCAEALSLFVALNRTMPPFGCRKFSNDPFAFMNRQLESHIGATSTVIVEPM